MSNQNQHNPWGRKKGQPSPDEMLANLIQKLRDTLSGEEKPSGGSGGERPPKPSSGNPLAGIGKVVLLLVAIVFFQVVYGSFFTIQPGEEGVILQFGKHVRTADSGLHFKIPYIEELIKVDVEGVRKAEFGFITRIPGQQSVFERGDSQETEALMLTGDKNVIHVAWIVQYKVVDSGKFLFKVRNVDKAVRDFSEMTIRGIVGNMDFDYVLSNREILAANAKRALQQELDNLESGVGLVALQLKDVVPPDPVKPAFNEVNEADQDMKRLVNEAEATYNRIIPKARGDAKKIVEEAHGYAIERTNRAKGEAERFNAIVAEYLAAEEVTRKRMYIETMQEVLSKVDHVYIMDQQQQSLLPLLDLRGQGAPPVPSQGSAQ